MRVEKRLSYGFKGVWGEVYKLYTFDVRQGVIKWQNNNYIVVDSKVQFKELNNNESKAFSQTVNNLITDGSYKTVATTDAYLNNGGYTCIVGMGDIVKLDGKYWAVDKINEQSIFVPLKHSVWYIGLKEILDEILTKGY